MEEGYVVTPIEKAKLLGKMDELAPVSTVRQHQMAAGTGGVRRMSSFEEGYRMSGVKPIAEAGGERAPAVLIVEDDRVSGHLLEAVLERSSLATSTIKIVSRLEQAAEDLAETAYDLVLLDLNLPDSSGAETVMSVIKACPDAAVVVVTGEYDENHAVSVLALGAQDYLVKGQYSTDALTRTVRYALARKQAERLARTPLR